MLREIEFACYNEDFPGSPSPEKLYALKEALSEMDGVMVYMQDFQYIPRTVSLAAILLDERKEEEVRSLAEKYGVAVDTVQWVPDSRLFDVITGRLEFLHMKDRPVKVRTYRRRKR